MEAFITKQEKKLYKALQTLLTHSVDSIGLPKKATSKQLYKASKALNDYDKYQREHRAQAKTKKKIEKENRVVISLILKNAVKRR